MRIPVYIVTGFLDAGKTTFLNNLLSRRDRRDVKVLVLQFESGEQEFYSRYQNSDNIIFLKKALEQQPNEIVGQIENYLQNHEIDEIWVEWNGVVPFTELQAIFLHPSLRTLCNIQKVVHIADGANIENLLGKTGAALPEQISSSDFVLMRNIKSPAKYKRIRHLLRGVNPGVGLYDIKGDIYKPLFRKKRNPIDLFLIIVALMVSFFLVAEPILTSFQIPVNMVVNVFLGIILQAFPFLLIGVLISSFIQVFIPQSFILNAGFQNLWDWECLRRF